MWQTYILKEIQMLKALWLSILGWFRTKAEEGTDLRYVGKEQFSRNQASIENVRKQRNSLAGDHLLLKKSITKTSTAVDEATAAFQKWTAEENKEMVIFGSFDNFHFMTTLALFCKETMARKESDSLRLGID